MDAALWRAARYSGAECRDNCEVLKLEGDGPFRLETSAGQIEAGFVIDTSGRWSRVRTHELSTGATGRWIGVKQHFCEVQPADSVDLYFFAGGYCGVQPVDNAGTVNACAMVRADVATQLEKVFEQQTSLWQRTRSWKPTGERVFTSPLDFREPSPVAGNVLRAGDVAGFIDPFAGDGIAIALESGFAAGEIAGASQDSAQAAHTYAAVYRKRFVPAFRAAARLRQMLELPKAVRWAALKLMKLPGVSERAIRATRARI
jgi:flavin-dependent dehydrogenase